MLFDTLTDPLELKNLADTPQLVAERKELSALVQAYAKQYDPAKGK